MDSHFDPHPPIVCTLAPEAAGRRAADWRAALAGATSREETGGGARIRFDRGTDVASLAALAAAENACCRWATFAVTIGPDDVTLEVTAPAGARHLVAALFVSPQV